MLLTWFYSFSNWSSVLWAISHGPWGRDCDLTNLMRDVRHGFLSIYKFLVVLSLFLSCFYCFCNVALCVHFASDLHLILFRIIPRSACFCVMYIYFLLLVHIPGGPFYEGLNRGVSALFVPNINLDINSNPMCLEIEKKRYNDIESHDFIVFDCSFSRMGSNILTVVY